METDEEGRDRWVALAERNKRILRELSPGPLTLSTEGRESQGMLLELCSVATARRGSVGGSVIFKNNANGSSPAALILTEYLSRDDSAWASVNPMTDDYFLELLADFEDFVDISPDDLLHKTPLSMAGSLIVNGISVDSWMTSTPTGQLLSARLADGRAVRIVSTKTSAPLQLVDAQSRNDYVDNWLRYLRNRQ